MQSQPYTPYTVDLCDVALVNHSAKVNINVQYNEVQLCTTKF